MSASPSHRPSRAAPPPEPEPEVAPLELVQFLLSAARRHWVLGLVLTLTVGGLGLLGVSAIPSVYESNAKIFDTQSSQITASVAGGRRSDDSAMRGLRETVFNRENLLSLVREAKLVERWEATRTWPFQVKDAIVAYLVDAPTQKDKERAMLDVLERSITVTAEETSSVRFRVQWRDPVVAYELAQLVQRNFLEVRRRSEVEAITRGITLIEEERKRADAEIEPAVKEMQATIARVREKKTSAAAPVKAPAPRVARPRVEASKVELTPRAPPSEVTERLEEIRRAQRNVLEPWQRMNAEAKFKLNELRVTYGPQHPSVRQQEARVAAASMPPPELADLKQQEEQLLASIARYGAESSKAVGAVRTGAGGGEGRSAAPDSREMPELESEDPEVGASRVKLNAALDKARELSDRLDHARMEIATANVSFKYRFAVVEPPELSRKPIKPRRGMLYAGAMFAAVLLGLLGGAIRELSTGRLMEPWQVRRLGIDILAEVDLRGEPPQGRSQS